MTEVEHYLPETDVHPIDMVETLAEQCSWDFDRVGEDQIAVEIEGTWHTYSLLLAWASHDDMLHLFCMSYMNPPEVRLGEFYRLLNIINDDIWGGCFTLWRKRKLLAYRCGLTLAGGAQATPEQIESMLNWAVKDGNRYYPAFQRVILCEDTAEAAMEHAIVETHGTA